MTRLSCFKAYDVRGKLGEALNESIAYRIGRGFAQYLNAKSIVLGGDVRESSSALKQALAQGIRDQGADVIDLGTTGTEEIYFASFHLDVDGGIEVTASHNPIDFNGMKFIGRSARPISADSGLLAIRALAEANAWVDASHRGQHHLLSLTQPYVEFLMARIDLDQLAPLKLVVNAGNGTAGPIIDQIERFWQALKVPITLIKLHHEPDGQFPNGIPNPLLPGNRSSTAEAVKAAKADMGIAWDADFDRCFFFDERGEFIEGYYMVGLLAEAFLKKYPGSTIIHDPRLVWNTIDIVQRAGGKAIQSKAGHAFIKEAMRANGAIYGGEMSAHHYFKDFAYCDSGMLPWLRVIELISSTGVPLSHWIKQSQERYPCSGERNYTVKQSQACLDAVFNHFNPKCSTVDHSDGLSMCFETWRFNLRASNTEPLLRLNIETKGDPVLLKKAIQWLEALILAQ